MSPIKMRCWRRHRAPRSGAVAAVRRIAALVGVALAAATTSAAVAQAGFANAGQPKSEDLLSLRELYDDVRRSNPRADAARALARAADARVPSAGLPADPQLQLGFMNYRLPGLRPMDPLGMTQLQLMQIVPVAGKLGLSSRIASAQAAAIGERATEVEWEMRQAAAVHFYDLYRTDHALVVARETLRLLDDIRRTAESMYRVGEGRQADVLRAQVEIARMVEDTVRMSTMRTGTAARLNALLDRAGDARVGAPRLPAFPDTVPSLETLVRLAVSARPTVRAGEHQLQAAVAEEKLARREIWPDLTVGLQYGQRSDEMGTDRMGSLMIGASVPIFARSRQLRLREEAAAMRQMAAADLRWMHAETRGRVTEAYADLMRARKLAQLYRTTVLPQAQAAATSAQAAYRVGSVDFMTLLDDQMTVNTYRQELFALEADEGRAWAELEMLVGQELFDAGEPRKVATAFGWRDER